MPFFALMWYYAVRLTYLIVPPLAVLAGLALPDLKPQRRRVAVWALTAVGGLGGCTTRRKSVRSREPRACVCGTH